jgi:GT2 family glycosyltransferase
MELPGVSILVLNFNGREHLERCFGSLEGLEYPADRLEVLFLDNASSDGSVEFVAERYPEVRIVRFERNLGFAAAMNAGVAEARHDVLVFLNNDTRVLPDSLRCLVRPIVEGRAGAAAAKIVSWDGSEVHFAGGGTNFHGIAFQIGMGEPDREEYRRESDTLFACGAAMAIRKRLFVEAGGFDEDFFAYYEDVDLGWRLWVLGERIRYVPDAVVHHHHSATSLNVEIYKLRVLHLRNPLQMIMKNYEEEHLRRILPAALLLGARRTWYLSCVDSSAFRIGTRVGTGPGGWLRKRSRSRSEYEESMEVPKLTVSDLVALNDVVDKVPEIMRKRERIQGRRRRPDSEILPLFRDPFRCAEANPDYARLQDDVCRFLGIRELFESGERE